MLFFHTNSVALCWFILIHHMQTYFLIFLNIRGEWKKLQTTTPRILLLRHLALTAMYQISLVLCLQLLVLSWLMSEHRWYSSQKKRFPSFLSIKLYIYKVGLSCSTICMNSVMEAVKQNHVQGMLVRLPLWHFHMGRWVPRQSWSKRGLSLFSLRFYIHFCYD